MKLLKKLGNPLALVAQGFAIGAFLFFAIHPETRREVERSFAAAPAAEARTIG